MALTVTVRVRARALSLSLSCMCTIPLFFFSLVDASNFLVRASEKESERLFSSLSLSFILSRSFHLSLVVSISLALVFICVYLLSIYVYIVCIYAYVLTNMYMHTYK